MALPTRLQQIVARDPEWLSLETNPAAESRYRGRYLTLDGAPYALGNLLGQGDEALVFELLELRTGSRESVIKICRHPPSSSKYVNWAVPYRIETNPHSALPDIEMHLARLVQVPGGLVKVQPYLSADPEADPTLVHRAVPILEKIEDGDLRGALKMADRLIKKQGLRPELLEAKGRALAEGKNWEEARQVLEQALEIQNRLHSYARFRTATMLANVLQQIYATTSGKGPTLSLRLDDGTILTQTAFTDVVEAAQDDTLQDRAMFILLEILADEPFFIPALRMLVDTLLDTWGTNMFAGEVVRAIEKIDPGSQDAKDARRSLRVRYGGDQPAAQSGRATNQLTEHDRSEVPDSIVEAQRAFDSAYRPEPTHGQLAHARYQSALSYLEEGDLDAAEEAAHRAIDLDREVVDYRLLMAEVFDLQKRDSEALRVLQEAVSDFPSDASVYQALGDHLTAHEKFAEAESIYLRALYCVPEEPWRIKLGLGRACRGLCRRPEALEWLHSAYQESAQDPNAVLALFYTLCDEEGNPTLAEIQEAAAIIREALSQHPDIVEYWVCQAQLQARNRQYSDAIGSLKRAISLDPAHPFAADFLAALEDLQMAKKQKKTHPRSVTRKTRLTRRRQ